MKLSEMIESMERDHNTVHEDFDKLRVVAVYLAKACETADKKSPRMRVALSRAKEIMEGK